MHSYILFNWSWKTTNGKTKYDDQFFGWGRGDNSDKWSLWAVPCSDGGCLKFLSISMRMALPRLFEVMCNVHNIFFPTYGMDISPWNRVIKVATPGTLPLQLLVKNVVWLWLLLRYLMAATVRSDVSLGKGLGGMNSSSVTRSTRNSWNTWSSFESTRYCKQNQTNEIILNFGSLIIPLSLTRSSFNFNGQVCGKNSKM